MEQLPANWQVKIDEVGIYKSTLLTYLNKEYGTNWKGVNDENCYYDVLNNKAFCSSCPSTVCTTILLTEFIEIINKKINMNNLPKYWGVRIPENSREFKAIIEKLLNICGGWKDTKSSPFSYSRIEGWYGVCNSETHKGVFYEEYYIPKECTELTLQELINLTTNQLTIKTIKENENRNQEGIKIPRTITTITRGPEIRGNSISGKPSRIKFELRHLSYTASYS